MQTNKALISEMPALRRYALTLTRDRASAEDLVQDCIERALRKWPLWQDTVPLRHWLFAMMRNLHVSRWRREHKHQAVELSETEAASTGRPEEHLEARQLMERVMELPEDQREALVLVAVEGFTYREVAEMLGTAEGTILSRVSRARATLRAAEGRPHKPKLRSVT